MIPPKPKATKAQCKLCGTIAVSFVETDRATCLCGEIAVIGGPIEMYKDNSGKLANILILDDTADAPSIKNKDDSSPDVKHEVPQDTTNSRTREDLLGELKRFIEADANLPENAHMQAISCVDLLRYMVVIFEILKLEVSNERIN